MASTYVNDLRLEEIGTGEQSGTWGTTTNTNLELIGEALSYGTEAITTNADTHTTTVADGAADPGRSIYLKYTGTLDSACTITIAPNTMSRLHFIENATSGSQNIIISQGTGANITIPPGDVKVVYLDGAGSGAAVVDAFASLNVVDLKVEDDLTVTDDVTVNGDIDLEGSIDVNGTTNLDAVDIDGATQIDATVTVGVDDTGYDVKFFGATSGAYMLWDESADDLKLVGAAGLTVAGDADIDGTTNLDAVDIDGATQIDATVTVGVDDTGYDVKFFGATSGAYMLWDESADDLKLVGAAGLTVAGDIDVDGTANLDVVDIDGAVDMASTLGVSGVVTANAGVVVDNITIDGQEIDVSSGDLTLDVAGDITLDADGGDVIISDGGTEKMRASSGSLGIGASSPKSSLNIISYPSTQRSQITMGQVGGTGNDYLSYIGFNAFYDASGNLDHCSDNGRQACIIRHGAAAAGSNYIEFLQYSSSLGVEGNVTIESGNLRAGTDDTYDLGSSSYRWDDIYATNGTIQTSDRNEKQDIEELSEAEKRVAVAAKGLLRKFRWKSAVSEKGDGARVHFGIIAQDLKAAFEAEGLDAGRYGMFIYEEWEDKETEETYNRMGVRYSELLAFIIASL